MLECVSPARKTSRTGAKHDEFEQSHRADRDPEEERCAGGSRDVIAEHGRRMGRPCNARHANDCDQRGEEHENQSNDAEHSTPLIPSQTFSTRSLCSPVNSVDICR